MQNLIFGFFLYKYGRAFITTLFHLTLGIIFFCLYGFYKLFQITVLAFRDSPLEMVLIFTFIGGLIFGVHRLQLRFSKKENKSRYGRVDRRSIPRVATNRRGY